MKKQYEEVKLAIVTFSTTDIVKTSGYTSIGEYNGDEWLSLKK